MFERIARSLLWLGELALDLETGRRTGRPFADVRAQRRWRSQSLADSRGVPASRDHGQQGGAGASGGPSTGRLTPREPPPGHGFVPHDFTNLPF